jgi:hypothetical protein
MQHTHTQDMPLAGHNTLWRAVIYLSLAAIGILAILEHSPLLLVVLAFFFTLMLALSERVKKIDQHAASNPRVSGHRLIGDGGCFPCREPEEAMPVSKPARVLDGGSLEHHHS